MDDSQARFFDHIVRAEEDLLAISEYILNNPVRRGLVEYPEDWPEVGNESITIVTLWAPTSG